MDDIPIDKLIRSRRNSIELLVTKEAKLIVRAPFFMPTSDIEKMVHHKRAWIIKKQTYFRSKPPAPIKRFEQGELFLFLGAYYALEFKDDLPKAVILREKLFVSSRVLKHARDYVRDWYWQMAWEHISQRAKELADMDSLKYSYLKINNARSRWGSCGSRGTLNFPLRLIMAPSKTVDYVIVHELMHLIHRSHSRKFWDEVIKRVPDYKDHERWLSKNSHLMIL
jgi:predicted metal-dependent hydrolase